MGNQNHRPSPVDNQPKNPVIKELVDACGAGQIQKVKELILSGADLNSRNENGYSPLHKAASFNRREIVDLLLDNKADINSQNSNGRTPLWFAVDSNEHQLVTHLVKRGADVEIPDDKGLTPLMLAANLGYTNCVKVLLDNNAKWQGFGSDSPPLRYIIISLVRVLQSCYSRKI
jgi:ankyrin repeat protein